MTASPGSRIDRYYDYLQSERERDQASNRPLLEETDVVEFFKRLGFQPTVYQEKLLRDKSQFILARWSRQSGKSLAMGSCCPLQRVDEERFQSRDCWSEQASEPEDDRQDLTTIVQARTRRVGGSA